MIYTHGNIPQQHVANEYYTHHNNMLLHNGLVAMNKLLRVFGSVVGDIFNGTWQLCHVGSHSELNRRA